MNRPELIAALSAVAPGLASQEILEQSTCFVFKEGKVFTYNDEIAIQHELDLGFEGAVVGDKLISYLNKAASEDADLSVEGGELRVKCGRSRAGFTLQAEINLPLEEIGKLDELDWWDLPEDFLSGLAFVRFSVSRDMSNPKITCAHVNGAYIESTDNYRMTRYELDEDFGFENLLVPGRVMPVLSKFKPISYATRQGWVYFENEAGSVLSCRMYAEGYPKLDPLLEVEGTEVELPDNLNKLLERASIFADADLEKDLEIELKLDKGKVTVSGKGAAGWFEETMKAKYKGESFSFKAHPGFMGECLTISNTVVVGENALKLSGDNFQHVVSLV